MADESDNGGGGWIDDGRRPVGEVVQPPMTAAPAPAPPQPTPPPLPFAAPPTIAPPAPSTVTVGMTLIQGGQYGSTLGNSAGATMPGTIITPRYEPAEFIVGGRPKSGKGGELEPITFKLHEGYHREIDKWLITRLFPYRDRSDLLRHAVVRHVRDYLPAMEGEVEGTLIHELAQIDQDVAEWRFQNEFIEHIERIAEQVNKTLQMPGGRHEVVRRLRKLKKQIDATKPSFHKNVYLKMFNDRFGAHLAMIALVETTSDDRAAVEDIDHRSDDDDGSEDE